MATINHNSLADIMSKRVFPIGMVLPIETPYLYDKKNPLTIIEHVFSKKFPELSANDPKNSVFLIGKLKKIMWKDRTKGKLIVDYDMRFEDADYFI